MYFNLFTFFDIWLGFKICKQDTIITYFPIGVNTEINFVKFIMSDMLLLINQEQFPHSFNQ